MTVVPTPNTPACVEGMTMNLATPARWHRPTHGRRGNAGRIACIAIGLLTSSGL